jgi:ABC-type multidrug transport system permease subunit
MTPFEIIILSAIYVFCLSFSVEMLMETECGKFERFLLLLLILITAPILTTIAIGMFIADIINKAMEE